MKDIKRKVGFYYLSLVNNENSLPIDEELCRLIKFIEAQTKKVRKQDISDDKFCLLDSSDFTEDDSILSLLFKSANHSYRAPLLNKNTIEERENPKTLDEGERKKTHLIVKFKDGDAIVFLETFGGALSLKQISEYLNHFIRYYNETHKRNKLLFHFGFSLIPRDDFREVLDSMQRVVCASVYIEKQILGSSALKFSERTNSVQEDVVLEIKAKRTENIKNTVYDIFAKLIGGEAIRKIKVTGKSSNNNDVVIDTDFIGKKEYVQAQQNEDTGEINSTYMFSQLIELSNTF